NVNGAGLFISNTTAQPLSVVGTFNRGGTSLTSLTVPSVALSAARSSAESDPIDLTASAQGGEGLDYAWTVTKTHGSVTTPYASGTGDAVNFIPDDDGTYVVSLTGTDANLGVAALTSESITVANAAPVVTAAANQIA